jgi:hypothetical protein
MKRFDVRVAIGTLAGPRSNVWHFFSRNDQVYAVHGRAGSVEKFSFHTPDVCRLALTKEYAIRSDFQDRHAYEWRRNVASNVGLSRVVRVLRIEFPTDLLSTALQPLKKTIRWITPAPTGGSTMIDLLFTGDSERRAREEIKHDPPERGHQLLAYTQLSNGEAFCLTSWFAPQASLTTLKIPASYHAENDLIVSTLDPDGTGRPIRLSVFSNPKDGDMMHVFDLGAFLKPPTDEVMPTISRSGPPLVGRIK